MRPKWVKTDEYFKNQVTSSYFRATHRLMRKTDKGWQCFLYKGVFMHVSRKTIYFIKGTYPVSSNDKSITRDLFNKKFIDSLKKAKLFGKYHS